MFSSIRILLFAAPLLVQAQVEIPAEFLEQKRAVTKRKAGLAEPLWRMTAGKQLLGARAHVAMEFDGTWDAARRERLSREGVRLVRAMGDNAWVAALDLNGSFGKELMAGGTGRMAELGIRAVAAVEENEKLDRMIQRGDKLAWATDEGMERGDFVVTYYPDVDHEQARREFTRLGIRILEESDYFHRFTLRLESRDLKSLARFDWVEYVEAAPPAPKTSDNSVSAQLIGTDVLQSDAFGLRGSGVALGIVDGGSLTAHVDFGDRVVNVDRTAPASAHATHVAGTMAASGESNPALRGMAPLARIYSWAFNGDVARKMLDGVNTYQTVTSQNSWGEGYGDFNGGCSLYGTYGTRERDLDRLVREQRLNIFFSAANERDTFECGIQPRGGTYTIPRPGTAKNIVTVGAVDRDKKIADFSSYGPVRDERVKPDIVALGVDVRSTNRTNGSLVASGTSMSTPAVSGTAALLVERFRQRNENQNPPAALIKGALLNTAEDLGNPGPDYAYGYGLLKAVEAVRVIDERWYVVDRVSESERNKRHTIPVADGAKALRVMLAYSDADANLSAASPVTNHLELVVTAPDGQRRVFPLRPNPRRPFARAEAREGARDTVKQVVVDQPAAGNWTAEIRGELQTAEQEYVVTWTTADNPLPPCSYVPTPSFQIIPEQGGSATVTVTAGAHCEPWSLQNMPEWLRVIGPASRQGTDLVKLGAGENKGEVSRDVRLRVGDTAVRVVQNLPCKSEAARLGEAMASELAPSDCFFDTDFLTYGRYFTFEAAQGQAVNIAAQSAAFDTMLYLLAPDGTPIAFNDDAGFATTNSRIPVNGNLVLPVSGKFTAVVTSFDERETGPFSVQVNLVNGQFGPAPAPRTLNGCPATVSGTITDNSSRYGRRGDLFPSDVVTFPARAGQTVTLEVTNSGFDTVLYLISPSGRLQATSTDTDGSGRARLTATLPQGGLWTIEVAPFSAFERGSYSLRVEGCTAP